MPHPHSLNIVNAIYVSQSQPEAPTIKPTNLFFFFIIVPSSYPQLQSLCTCVECAPKSLSQFEFEPPAQKSKCISNLLSIDSSIVLYSILTFLLLFLKPYARDIFYTIRLPPPPSFLKSTKQHSPYYTPTNTPHPLSYIFYTTTPGHAFFLLSSSVPSLFSLSTWWSFYIYVSHYLLYTPTTREDLLQDSFCSTPIPHPLSFLLLLSLNCAPLPHSSFLFTQQERFLFWLFNYSSSSFFKYCISDFCPQSIYKWCKKVIII